MNLGHRRLNAWSRMLLPPETWTDILKLLPRRTLVQHIQPVNYCFKEICDKNVKCVHIIEQACQFTWKMHQDEPEASRQLAELAGSKCALAEHFRMAQFPIFNIRKKSMQAALRHCLDLFQGCQVQVCPRLISKVTGEQLAYLSLLEQTKPVCVNFESNMDIKTNLKRLLRHPTILNCSRLKFGKIHASNRCAIFDWLHHRATGIGVGSETAEIEPEVRCLIFFSFGEEHKQFIEWLFCNCVQNLRQARRPSDRRNFVLSFKFYGPSDELNKFGRIENPTTGEVLVLEPVPEDGQPVISYHFRRCLASCLANGAETKEFYAKMFKSIEQFNCADEWGREPAELIIY